MSILHRIDATLEKARFRQMEVRAIYLTEADHDLFDRAMSRRFKRKAAFLSYGDIHIRRSKRRSTVFCEYGIEIVVPKSLSPRTQKLAA